jgi:hypothetical protein
MKKIVAVMAIVFMMVVGTGIAEEQNISKYVTIAPDYNFAQPQAPGFVQFHIFANPAQDYTIWVVNDLQNITRFDKEFRYDDQPIIGQNPDIKSFEVPACGVILTQWNYGDFTAYMQNSNGNQMETIHFRVGAGDTDRKSTRLNSSHVVRA